MRDLFWLGLSDANFQPSREVGYGVLTKVLDGLEFGRLMSKIML